MTFEVKYYQEDCYDIVHIVSRQSVATVYNQNNAIGICALLNIITEPESVTDVPSNDTDALARSALRGVARGMHLQLP